MLTLDFYRSQSKFSSLGHFSTLASELPDDVSAISSAVHNLVVHQDGLEPLYNIQLSTKRATESNSRYVERMLEIIFDLNKQSLIEPRLPLEKFIGSCRDFAVFTCSILREKGIPARVRVGFANYFHQDWYSDHWICEFWNEKLSNWQMVDSELGKLEREKYQIKFNFLDVPRDKFINGARAWQLCRTNKINPNKCGVFGANVNGWWFVRADLLRDFAALVKIELLPWDYTEFMNLHFDELSELKESEINWLDELSESILSDKMSIDKLTEYQKMMGLDTTIKISSYTQIGKKVEFLNG